jgi:hypothetical protein
VAGQKEAVVEKVKNILGPTFTLYKDVAMMCLNSSQLEQLKVDISDGIASGNIEYSKDRTIWHEVRAYARSMVMHHLKKARELNGNGSSPKAAARLNMGGIDTSVLTEDLAELVKGLFNA